MYMYVCILLLFFYYYVFFIFFWGGGVVASSVKCAAIQQSLVHARHQHLMMISSNPMIRWEARELAGATNPQHSICQASFETIGKGTLTKGQLMVGGLSFLGR